jgi:DnaJ-class molecular chaperone
MSILYRGHSIDASYQMLVHFGEAISGEKILLEIDQSETRIACDGHVCERIASK